MTIIVNDFVDIVRLKDLYPDFHSVDDLQRDKIELGMEVKTRRNGENFRIRINGVSDDTLTGEVISGTFFFNQPFELGDTIQFEKKNVIDIYDIDRWGILI